MIVRGTQTHKVEMDIADVDLLKAAIEVIEGRYKLRERWIQDGWVMEDDPWHHGSHTSHKVSEATKEEIEAFKLITALRAEVLRPRSK